MNEKKMLFYLLNHDCSNSMLYLLEKIGKNDGEIMLDKRSDHLTAFSLQRRGLVTTEWVLDKHVEELRVKAPLLVTGMVRTIIDHRIGVR